MVSSQSLPLTASVIRSVFYGFAAVLFAGHPVFAFPQVDSTPVSTSIEGIRGTAVLKLVDNVKLPAERSGVLTEVLVAEGYMVRKGDLLAKIKTDENEIRLQRASIEDEIARLTSENDVDIRYADKSLEVVRAMLQRSLDSNSRIANSVPLVRIEQQQLDVHRDELRLEQAKRDHRIAKMKVGLAQKDMVLSQLLVDKSKIVAPMDGMVVAVESKPGEWVEPGQTILKIIKLDQLKLDGFVSAEDASRIRVGDKVIATVHQPGLTGEKFAGEVIFKNPEANPVNATVQIWALINNADLKLMAGLPADIQILPAEQ